MNDKKRGIRITRYDRKVRTAIYIAIIIGVGMFTQTLMHFFIKQNVGIAEVFTNSKVATAKSSIEMAGEYKTKSLSEEERKSIVYKIAKNIGLDITEDDFVVLANTKISELSVSRTSQAASTRIQVISVNVNQDGEIPIIHNYIMVRLEIYEQAEQIVAYKKLLQKTFDSMGVTKDSSYIQFTGTYPGELKLDDKNQLTNQMIQSLGARITYENRADHLYTVYAYSAGLNEYISVGKSKVNIQVAMTYNEKTNETIVYLATPIMNGSY